MFMKLKLVVASCVVLASLGAAASAGATTATITNGGSVTATANTGILFTAGARQTGCTTAGATATLAGASGTLPLTISRDFQLLFPAPSGVSCVIIGGLNATISCGLGTLQVTGLTSGGLTPIALLGISCRIWVTASPTCNVTVSGSVRGQFDNAGSRLTIFVAGQSLVATGSTCPILPNGTDVLTSTTSGNVDYAVRQTSSGLPVTIAVV
jgi:hypothetical protein